MAGDARSVRTAHGPGRARRAVHRRTEPRASAFGRGRGACRRTCVRESRISRPKWASATIFGDRLACSAPGPRARIRLGRALALAPKVLVAEHPNATLCGRRRVSAGRRHLAHRRDTWDRQHRSHGRSRVRASGGERSARARTGDRSTQARVCAGVAGFRRGGRTWEAMRGRERVTPAPCGAGRRPEPNLQSVERPRRVGLW